MGRHRLPEDQVKEKVPLRLPRYLIDWLKQKGSVGKQIEAFLLEKYKKDKERK